MATDSIAPAEDEPILESDPIPPPPSVFPIPDHYGFAPSGDLVWVTGPSDKAYVFELDLARSVGDFGNLPVPAVAGTVWTNRTHINAVGTFRGFLWAGRPSEGPAVQMNTYHTSGTLTTSKVTFGLGDRKAFEDVQLQFGALPSGASISVDVVVDGTRTVLGSVATAGATSAMFPIRLVGVAAHLEIGLTRGTGTPPYSPILHSWTLRAAPIPLRGEEFVVPIILRERVQDVHGNECVIDPAVEFARLKALETAGVPIEYQEFGNTYRVIIDQIQFGPELDYTADGRGLQGLCLLRLRRFGS